MNQNVKCSLNKSAFLSWANDYAENWMSWGTLGGYLELMYISNIHNKTGVWWIWTPVVSVVNIYEYFQAMYMHY